MKKKLSITIHSLFFVICAALAVSVLYHMVFTRRLNLKYTPAVLEESARELDNPYRGFYRMIGYILSDDRKPAEAAAWCSENCDSNPYPLMLLEINLKNYSNSNISTKARNQLDKILEQCLLAKKQVILRFLYDWDGQAMSTEPSDLSWIKKHISQLSSTVNKYSDCIYILQGTLTGNNGEMNNSNYGEINQIRQIFIWQSALPASFAAYFATEILCPVPRPAMAPCSPDSVSLMMVCLVPFMIWEPTMILLYSQTADLKKKAHEAKNFFFSINSASMFQTEVRLPLIMNTMIWTTRLLIFHRCMYPT